MEMRLLEALLRKKDIVVEDIKDFYELNIEQTIELLLNFLRQKLNEVEQHEKNALPKYLFRTLQKVDHLYEMFADDGKNNLPNYRLYQELQKRLFTLVKYRKVSKDSKLPYEQQWYVDIYYYRREELLKRLLSIDEFFRDLEINSTMIDDLIQSYFQSFSSGSHIEYQYFKHLLTMVLTESESEILTNHVLQQLEPFMEEQLKNTPSNYRLNELIQLCVQIKYQDLNRLNNYQIAFSPEKHSIQHEIFTIDEENTELREDALSIRVKNGITCVTMYITDPTDEFIHNEKLMDEAFSNWFLHQKDYIFDFDVAKKQFSLDKGKKRSVIAYELVFDEENNLLKIDVYPTRIFISENYSYNSMQAKMKQLKDSDAELLRLLEIAKTLHEANYSKKRYHKLKELQYYLEYNKRYQPESKYMVISEFKILLGTLIAKEFSEKNIPMIYRNNESQVTKQVVEQIEEKCNQMNEISEIRRKIASLNLRSYYSYENIGHSGLGVKQYTHITTPLRNYFSLINMMILKDVMINKNIEEIGTYQELVERLTEIQYEKQHYKQKVFQLRNITKMNQGE